MKAKILLCVAHLLFIFSLAAEETFLAYNPYQEIADIYHPTLEDYRLIQDYLSNGYRPLTSRLRDYEPNAKNFRIIGEAEDQVPQFGLMAVNSPENERENCLVVYSSFN
jgi:hypothetical protein